MASEIEVTWELYRHDPNKRGTLHGSVVMNQAALLTRLRNAGIPIVGSICVEGVEFGTLTIYRDKTFGETVYRWSSIGPDGEDEDPAAGL